MTNTHKYHRAGKPAVFEQDDLALGGDDFGIRQSTLSSALASVFRGKFCDAILPNRHATRFQKGDVIYDVGGKDRTFFFLLSGFVKVGTITSDGHEVIYDVRKGGDVVGELCASQHERADRAVAVEDTKAVPVPYDEVIEVMRTQLGLLHRLVELYCRALAEAYEQVSILAVDDTVHRLVKALLRLAGKIGHRSGYVVEIPTYLTQEEISQMVAARRERVSTALNYLRRRGMVPVGCVAFLPTRNSGAQTAEGKLQRGGGGTRQGGVQRCGAMFDVPRLAAFHRARLEHAYPFRDRH
jgi:CRP/FNR family cyclic AMP-dependent transcriptional regulator